MTSPPRPPSKWSVYISEAAADPKWHRVKEARQIEQVFNLSAQRRPLGEVSLGEQKSDDNGFAYPVLMDAYFVILTSH